MESKDEQLATFSAKCEDAVKEAKDASVKSLCSELPKLLAASHLETTGPIRVLFQALLENCRGEDDKYVTDTMKRFAPLVERLIKEADQWRFKVQALLEITDVAVKMGLPRLSPQSALLEVVFDGLYSTEVIEEQYFGFWSLHDDVNIGAVFQVRPFLDFLADARIQGEDYDDSMEWTVHKGKCIVDESDDLHVGVMSIEAAKMKAMDLGEQCKGFHFEGLPDDVGDDLVEVTFKSATEWFMIDANDADGDMGVWTVLQKEQDPESSDSDDDQD